MHSFIVQPVEGRMVPNPRVPGRIVGYESHADDANKQWSTTEGRMIPGRLWSLAKLEAGQELEVTETNDGYFRKAILHGDLSYVTSKDGTRKFIEPELLRASVKHQKARKAQSEANEQAAKEQAELAALDALAAAEGLTVEEFKAAQAAEAAKGNQ